MKLPKRKHNCVLCKAPLSPSPYDGLWLHPESVTCQVRVTDHLGLSVDDQYGVDAEGVFAVAAEPVAEDVLGEGAFGAVGLITTDGVVVANLGGITPAFVSVEVAAKVLFEQAGLPYLGGSSGSYGWSSVSTFQKCPYLWKKTYGARDAALGGDLSEALEVGSITHIFLAIHYSQWIDPTYPLTPEDARRYFAAAGVTPLFVDKAWTLFESYRIWHQEESAWMIPLAVEELAVDPRTGFSCRWDLVFKVEVAQPGILPGVYICNHKSAADNSFVTREQWKNDGQILGEINLYNALGYHRRFGPLRGACVNLLIKTQNPQFIRAWVMPPPAILRDHAKSLLYTTGQMRMAEATNCYPRMRAACVTRYRTLCEFHEHCAGGDAAREIEEA